MGCLHSLAHAITVWLGSDHADHSDDVDDVDAPQQRLGAAECDDEALLQALQQARTMT